MGKQETIGSLLYQCATADGQWPHKNPVLQPDKLWEENMPDDVSRLDMRIGKVLNVHYHMCSKKYYKIEVHIGEEKERMIVNRLGQIMPMDDILDRYVILLCNVRHMVYKIMSNAFILYAINDEGTKAELLKPPPYGGLGDRVYVPGYPFNPFQDLPYIWPNKESKRVYEAVEKDLRINSKGQAEYKGTALRSIKKGFVTVDTLTDCAIKK